MTQTESALGLAAWLAFTFLAPLAGFRARPDGWYRALSKPSWNPPPWLFGPVWTLLYTLMAVAAWMVWRQGGWAREALPLALYVAQLALNAAWTPIFFGAHRIGLALADVALLWLAILATLVAFAMTTPVAGLLLVPYLAWVTFASALNFQLWRLNQNTIFP
jgi:tryptophan-rich sensory protein